MKRIRKWVKKLKYIVWDLGIKPIFVLLFHDFKTIRTNFAALLIVAGLCFIPSLYAWINIYACWDPYGNTGNLPVAIVNNDEGAAFEGKIINVGESIVDEMQENKAINWHFVDEWQANNGLNTGQYYAMIEIPDNFSERLISLTTATPQKPAIIYRSNEKLNAIAAKITNVAKEKLVNNVKSNFVQTVNDEILTTFNDKAEESDIDDYSLDDVKESLEKVNKELIRLTEHLKIEKTNSQMFKDHLSETNHQMENLLEQMDSMQTIVEATSRLNSAQDELLTKSVTALNQGISDIQSLNTQNQELINQLIAINNNTMDDDLQAIMYDTIDICDQLVQQIEADKIHLKDMDPNEEKSYIKMTKSSLDYLEKLLKEEEKQLYVLIGIEDKDQSKERIDEALKTLKVISTELSVRTVNLSSYFYGSALPAMNTLSGNLGESLDDAVELIDASKVVVPQYNALSAFMIASTELNNSERDQMIDILDDVNVQVKEALDKVNDIDDEKVKRLIDLVRNHPDEITDFLAEPLDVEVEDLYEVDSFGVAISPFYTTLAIWVGVLLMSSLLSTESPLGNRYSMAHVHISKMILYLIISLIQSTIIVIGDIHVLGVVPQSTPLMFLFGALTSLTFVAIIYTLVAVLGNVGKAVAIIIMIFQIAGSGGIYPIETNPAIFGMLQPLWPFTYAIGGFREAIIGPYGPNVAMYVRTLLKIVIIVLPFGLLKRPFHKLIHFFEHKFEEADLK